MIIRCPECSTGFNLPDERVTPEGTKLKCSRCKHVFRVRADADGEPEFFYRPGDNEGDSKSGGGSGAGNSPFSNAGSDLKPKKSSAFGDLDDDDGQVGAFESAVASTDETSELNDVVEEAQAKEKADATSSGGYSAPAPSPSATPAAQQDPSVGALSGSNGSLQGGHNVGQAAAGAAGQAVAAQRNPGGATPAAAGPGAGAGGPSPAAGAPGPASGPPKNAVGPPPTAKVKKNDAPQKSVPATAQPDEKPRLMTGDWDVDDSLAPQRLGPSMATKALAFLLALSVLFIGFMWFVAVKNDGFIDFDAFSDMTAVAFSDGEYEPRPEWAPVVPDVVIVEPTEAASVEGVHGELVQVGQDDHVFVLQGMVRNNESSRIFDVELRAMVMSAEGRTMQEVVSPLYQGAEMGEFRNLQDMDELEDLLGSSGVRIDPGGVEHFTLVLDNPPHRVIDGERYFFRVEVANMGGGDQS